MANGVEILAEWCLRVSRVVEGGRGGEGRERRKGGGKGRGGKGREGNGGGVLARGVLWQVSVSVRVEEVLAGW